MSLFDIYKEFANINCYNGSDKGTSHSYLDFYNTLLKNYENVTDLDILEIGACSGAWSEVMSKYLPNSNITSIDINLELLKFGKDNKNINFIEGDATDHKLLSIIYNKMFNIIIDDGSHLENDILKTLDLYFFKLKNNGKYVIEDINLTVYPNLIDKLINFCKNYNKNYEIFDLRHIKGRFDDYIFVIYN